MDKNTSFSISRMSYLGIGKVFFARKLMLLKFKILTPAMAVFQANSVNSLPNHKISNISYLKLDGTVKTWGICAYIYFT